MRVVAFLPFIWLGAGPCWAALGQPVESVASDQRRLHGELRLITRDGYSVREISSADGSLVREYASANGPVFAVVWKGPIVPDLSQLLGSYFSELRDATRSPVRRRGPLQLRTRNLVVETGGHMRAFQGRAYLPAALPDGVSEAVVR